MIFVTAKLKNFKRFVTLYDANTAAIKRLFVSIDFHFDMTKVDSERCRKESNLMNASFSNFACVNRFCFRFCCVTRLQSLNFDFSKWKYTDVAKYSKKFCLFMSVEMKYELNVNNTIVNDFENRKKLWIEILMLHEIHMFEWIRSPSSRMTWFVE